MLLRGFLGCGTLGAKTGQVLRETGMNWLPSIGSDLCPAALSDFAEWRDLE